MNRFCLQQVIGVLIALVSGPVGCGDSTPPPAELGSIRAQLTADAPDTVLAIHLRVTGSGFTPIDADLENLLGVWTGTVDNVPAGTLRTVTAYAYDIATAPSDLTDESHLIYKGTTTVTVNPDVQNPVAITLVPFPPDNGNTNTAPHLVLLTYPSSIAAGLPATLTAKAIDPDLGDMLTYEWSDNGAGGSFAGTNPVTIAPDMPISVDYTPPGSSNAAVLIQLRVSDILGASTTTAFHLIIGVGVISPTVSFDVLPALTIDSIAPALLPGMPTQINYSLTNPSGSGSDELDVTVSWSDNCGAGPSTAEFGSYPTRQLLDSGTLTPQSVVFTAPGSTAANRCDLTVTITATDTTTSLSSHSVIWVEDLGKIVFATSTDFPVTGAFGGLEAADNFCQFVGSQGIAAGKLPQGTTYRAFLSDSTHDIKDSLQEGPYVLADGTLVATTNADMFAWGLLHAIDRDEQGLRHTGALDGGLLQVFTGTKTDGTHAATTCQDWTSGLPGDTAAQGSTGALDESWVDTGSPVSCDSLASVYCFQTTGP
jgi:hypothetical protein